MNATGDRNIGVVVSKRKDDDTWEFNCAFETYESACKFADSMNNNKMFTHMEFRPNKTVLFSNFWE